MKKILLVFGLLFGAVLVAAAGNRRVSALGVPDYDRGPVVDRLAAGSSLARLAGRAAHLGGVGGRPLLHERRPGPTVADGMLRRMASNLRSSASGRSITTSSCARWGCGVRRRTPNRRSTPSSACSGVRGWRERLDRVERRPAAGVRVLRFRRNVDGPPLARSRRSWRGISRRTVQARSLARSGARRGTKRAGWSRTTPRGAHIVGPVAKFPRSQRRSSSGRV